MRAHKQEPMIFLSIIGALLTGVSTIVGGYYFSSIGMAIGYLLINITFGIPFTYILFKKFKNLNHN
jgi:O-antigen/teichoic acid export membrane protein